MVYEKYLEKIQEVYRKTESYAISNKKVWGMYLENPTIENRNKVLMRNIWIVNSVIEYILKINPSLKGEDLFGEGIILACKAIDYSRRTDIDSKKMPLQIYLWVKSNLILKYVKNYQEELLDFYETMDVFESNKSEEPLWREDFRRELYSIIEAALTSRDEYILLRTMGEKGEWIKGKPCKTLEEVGWDVGLSRERIRQIKNKSISKLHDIAAGSSIVKERNLWDLHFEINQLKWYFDNF